MVELLIPKQPQLFVHPRLTKASTVSSAERIVSPTSRPEIDIF